MGTPVAASPEEGEAVSAQPPSGAEANPAATVRTFEVSSGSLVFTVTVDGDGETLATSPDTKWYQPIFGFETPEGDIEIQGEWGRGQPFEAMVFDQDFQLIDDVIVTGDWTAPDTFVVVAEGFGAAGLPERVTLDLLVRVDDAGTNVDYGDTAFWEG